MLQLFFQLFKVILFFPGVEDFDLPSIEEKNLCQLVVEWLERSLDSAISLNDLVENVSGPLL